MEMPRPTALHKQLEGLAGTWIGEEQMHASSWAPAGYTASASLTNRVACDGFYVTGDYEQKREGVVTFRGHSVFGCDPKSGEITLHWFDSMGLGVDVFRGSLAGQRLTLTCQNAMGTHRLAYDLSEKGTLRSRMESSKDGKQWAPMFDGVYHRKS
jgi:hypothetical protein